MLSLSDLGIGLHGPDLEAQPVSDSGASELCLCSLTMMCEYENSGLLALGSGGLMLQAREFKYLGVLYTSDRLERKMDRRFVEGSVVMQALYWTIVVKEDLLLCLCCDPQLWS